MIRTITRRQTLQAMSLIAAGATLGGCATVRRLFDMDRGIISVKDEQRLGIRFAERLEADLKIHPSEGVQSYATQLGGRLLASIDLDPDGAFSFKVIDDARTIRASALLGGRVHIYSGLMMMVETEAELAAVIGHEIAHVTERHMAERLATQGGLDELQAYVEQPGTVLPDFVQRVSSQVGQTYLLNFSRMQESAADTLGLTYTVNAGYNPHRFIDFFERIQIFGASNPNILSAHPDPVARIEDIRRFINSLEDVPDYEGGEAFEQVQVALWGPGGRPIY